MISCGLADAAKMNVSSVIMLFRFGLRAGAALPPVCQDPEEMRPLRSSTRYNQDIEAGIQVAIRPC